MARDLPARSRPTRARVIPARFLRTECDTLVRTITHLSLATPEEIEPYRPGGAQNPATDAYGWLSFYRRLHRLHARVEESGGTGPRAATASEIADDELLLGALREDPVAVALVSPVPDGPDTLVVRPLGEQALRHLDARDDLLTCLARHAQALASSAKPDEHTVRVQVLEEISYQRAVCIWSCTSEAAPRLPFDPVVTPRPDVPSWLLALQPVDALRVQAAHHRLHAVAIQTLRRFVALDASGEQTQGSWRTFFAALARDSQWTLPAQHFMRDRALVSLLVSRALAADADAKAYEEARAKAKAEADAERGGR